MTWSYTRDHGPRGREIVISSVSKWPLRKASNSERKMRPKFHLLASCQADNPVKRITALCVSIKG